MTPSILTRLEEGGSRELDREIMLALFQNSAGNVFLNDSPTTSVDAALALAERLGLHAYTLDGSVKGRWSWMVVNCALLGDLEAEPYTTGVAKTPAAALCIAILKAKALQDGRDG